MNSLGTDYQDFRGDYVDLNGDGLDDRIISVCDSDDVPNCYRATFINALDGWNMIECKDDLGWPWLISCEADIK